MYKNNKNFIFKLDYDLIISKDSERTGVKNNKESDSKSLKSLVIQKLSTIFLPEFLNRFDEIIIFKPLTMEQLKRISTIMINKIIDKAKTKNITLTVDDTVKLKLVRESYNPSFGARPLRRAITKFVEDRISEIILENYKDKNKEMTIRLAVDLFNNIIHEIFIKK